MHWLPHLFYDNSEEQKKLNQALAWRKVQKLAAENAKQLGYHDKSEELLAESMKEIELNEDFEIDEVSMEEEAVNT